MDPWKDPEGVLKVYEHVREKVNCRLLYCYNLATDERRVICAAKSSFHNDALSRRKQMTQQARDRNASWMSARRS